MRKTSVTSSRRFFCLAVLFFLLAGTAGLLPCLLYRLSSIQADFTRPVSHSIIRKIPLSGTITAQNSTEVVPKFPLVIRTVRAKEGDTVKAGEVLAVIDRNETLLAAASLLAAFRGAPVLPDWLRKEELSAFQDPETFIPSSLISPASGTILASTLLPGSLIPPGISCMTIADCSALSASLSVSESEASVLSAGQKVYLRSAAEKIPFSARITDISPAAVRTFSGTGARTMVEVTASVGNTGSLKPGYSVSGYLFCPPEKPVLLLPSSAVYQEDEQEYVYLWQAGKAVRKNIRTKGLYQNSCILSAGLSETDIVLLCKEEPREGSPVKSRKTAKEVGP